jgi:hypothetical protein
MHASTVRHAAGTVGERIGDIAHTVVEKAPDVGHRVGDITHTVVEKAPDVGHRVGDIAHTVVEKVPDVGHRVGDTAHRLAAKTPWIEAPKPPAHDLRRWVIRIAVLAAVAAAGWWLAMRRDHEPVMDEVETPSRADERRFAAVGS